MADEFLWLYSNVGVGFDTDDPNAVDGAAADRDAFLSLYFTVGVGFDTDDPNAVDGAAADRDAFLWLQSEILDWPGGAFWYVRQNGFWQFGGANALDTVWVDTLTYARDNGAWVP